MAETAVAVRPSWLVRALTSVRALTLVTAPTESKAGSDFGMDVAVEPTVDPITQMSALGTFSWIYIAVNLCSRDLAAIPRKVLRGEGEKAKVIEDHPFTRLMRQPRSRIDGVSYSRQRWADWYLAGNAYDLVLRPKLGDRPIQGVPWSLARLHPGRTRLLTESDGDPRGFEYDLLGDRVYYGWEDVIWCGGISWEDDPRGSYGQGAIRALVRDLNIAHAASGHELRASKRGRPDFMVRPAKQEQAGQAVVWTPEQTRKIREIFDKALQQSSGGALVIGGAAEVDPLTMSPRDVGSLEIHTRVRDTVLAAFGIPPSKAGVPGVANYATAQIEDLSYWEARRSDAALRDEADSRLARMMGHPDDRVVSDWSGVRAFQEDRSERQNRARGFWLMGLPVKSALKAEGFDAEAAMLPELEADVEQSTALNGAQVASATSIVQSVALGQLPRDSGVAMLQAMFGLSADVAESMMGSAGNGFVPAAAPAPPAPAAPAEEPARAQRSASRDDEAETTRAARWRSWEETIRGPLEDMMRVRMERFFGQQLDRYTARLTDGRSGARASEDDISGILDNEAEIRRLIDEMGPDIQTALRRAFKAVAKDVGASLTYEPSKAEVKLIEEFAARVQGTTAEKVEEVLRQALSEGKSVSDIGEDLRRSTWFSAERAMRVARTETTRAVNTGALQAMADAQDDGVELDGVEWLSARDGSVRDEHADLDGQVVELGGDFEVAGDKAKGPGMFSRVELNVNCRCTVLPVVR